MLQVSSVIHAHPKNRDQGEEWSLVGVELSFDVRFNGMVAYPCCSKYPVMRYAKPSWVLFY
jgi:hypothetical protein